MSLWKRIRNWITSWLERIREAIRRFLDWLARNSGGGGPVENIPACCGLAVPEKECNWIGSKDQFTCPEGSQRTWWTCCEGSELVYCGECAGGSSCFTPPWECSIWWKTGEKC